MDIHHLRVFSSVYKNRSFSKAAEELYLTQPTISDHIRALEEELNCKLFDRLSRKIIPTREAVLLIVKAQEIIDKLDGFKDSLGEFRKDLTGHIIIGASTIPGTYILPSVTASFRKDHPSVLFEIAVSDTRGIIEKIAEHNLLIGIVGAKLSARQVKYTPFLDDELIVIAPRSFTKKRNMDLREIIGFPMVMREQGSGTRREFETILGKAGIEPAQLNIAGIFGSTDAVKHAVKEGMGISVVSRRSVIDEIGCNMLKEIKISDFEMKRQFYIVVHEKRSLPHLYKTFLAHITKKADRSS
jgi:DNA-binding transcriptional LysR family regulator